MQEIRIGNIYGATGGNFAGNVYDKNGIAPTINTCGGGGREPMIIEQQIVAMRGRDKTNPGYRGKANENFEQVLEPNSEGIANTITTVQKDNMVLELGHIEKGTGKHQSNIVYDSNGISPCLCAGIGVKQQPTMHCEVEVLGGIGEIDFGKQYRQGNRVYNAEKISPALSAQPLGNAAGNSPLFVDVKQATKEGLIPCEVGGVADLSYPTSQTRRGRVQGNGQICPTLTTENIPSVLEPWIWEVDGIRYLIRIRKLTPKECWRLMDFKDEDFNKAAAVNSNTQLYKQAGNSIVKNVLCEVFNQLIKGE